MKRIAAVISAMAAAMLFSAITILGAENYPVPFESYGKGVQSSHKNECLLVAKNCATESSTVRQRVIDLRKEIAKGYKAYTPTELNILKEQLKWIEFASDNAELI
jgi:hypothetical protein